METIELKKMVIPIGNTREDNTARRKIIWDFYEEWKKKNPLQKKYNIALKAYINIRYVSIDETSYQASKSFLSTLSVLQLDSVLTLSKPYKTVNAKQKDKNQKRFNKLIWMKHILPGIGEVKLLVGIARRTKEKVQYCITAIQT